MEILVHYVLPIAWVISVAEAAAIARRRGASTALWFALGCLTGPIALLAALFSGPRYVCPECLMAVHREDTKCKQCTPTISPIRVRKDGKFDE